MSDAGAATGKVVVHRTMSLDGFIAGPGDSMDWIFEYPAADQAADVMVATGAILAGRRTYEVGSAIPGNQPAKPTKARGKERNSCSPTGPQELRAIQRSPS